jgi:hypothetical protein
VVGKKRNTQIFVYLPVTYVPGGTSSKAKTLGLQHLQIPDMGAGCGSPRGVPIIHHGEDELLLEQDSVPDGEITLPVQEGNQHSQTFGSLLPDLIGVRRKGESCV